MSHIKVYVLGLFLLCLCVGLPAAAEEVSKTVYICIDPIDAEAYLIQFSAMNLFGVVIPQDANVTLYSRIGQALTAVGYSITSDQQSVSYQRGVKIATLYAGNHHAGERACNEDYPETRDILSTIPFPISANHALIVQVGDPMTYDPIDPSQQPCDLNGIVVECQAFLGVFSIHIRPLKPPAVIFQRDIQFIQLEDGNMDINLRYLSRIFENNTLARIIVIANKYVVLSRKSIEQTEFASSQNADNRDGFVPELSSRPVTDDDPDNRLNLFDLMREGKTRILPQYGLVYDYPIGGFVRLNVNTSEASREFRMNPGDCVRPLPGTRANYFSPDSIGSVFGYLSDATNDKEAEIAKINSILPNGELHITDTGKQGDYILEAPWLIDSIPCPV